MRPKKILISVLILAFIVFIAIFLIRYAMNVVNNPQQNSTTALIETL